MKKTIRYILITFSLILLCFSLESFLFIKEFNSDSVVKNIGYLSSNTFKGRLPGTSQNKQTAEFIKNTFNNNGLTPYNKTYFHNFYCHYPMKVSGNPYLKIINSKNETIKEYSYGKDFKEDMLNFRENKFTFNKHNQVVQAKNVIQIKNGNNIFIIYSPENNKLNFRSSFIKDDICNMYIMVTQDVLKDLKRNVNIGYNISCFIPYTVQKALIPNVVSCIKGVDSSKPPLILSAHFDHLGEDLNGTMYPGALDNASGTCFLLELSKYIKSLGTPNRDILFVAFNAEEFGCIGSKVFAERFYNRIKDSTVINFDMIGGNQSVPLCIMGSDKDNANTPLIKDTSYRCSSEHINFNYMFEDASDHCSFRAKNIKASI